MMMIYLKGRLLLLALMLASLSAAWAQTRTVSGKVTASDDGSPLPGVNVQIKGTSTGTVTDANGSYSISVGNDAVLVFSFVGYTTQEVTVGSQTTIDVSLQADITALSEIVVVGYGTQEKKEITSAVASIKSENFNRGTVNDPAQLLAGKVAGLSIVRPGGDPNAGSTIRLRGVTTIGANSEPLIVIDGVIGGSLSTVDPNDIESIDVLKDGSAAAIYGVRGSSGVIIITTRAGKAGRFSVDYNGSYAVESIARTIKTMDAAEYRTLPGAIDLGGNTDWLDVVTQTGQTSVHNIAVSGGTSSTTYRASFNYRDAQGINLNSGFSQLIGRLNITQKALNDRATVALNFATTTRNSSYGFTEALRYAVVANPTLPVYYTGAPGLTNIGGYAERDIFDFFNPLSIAEQNKNEGKDKRLLLSIRGEYDFSDVVNGLRASVFYSRQEENDLRGEFYAKTSKFRGLGRNGLASRRTDNRFNELFETTINYDKSFGDANLALLGGYSYQYFFFEGFGMEGGNFLTNAFTYNNMSAALDFANGLGSVYSYANSNKLVAFFGRANLNFKRAYFLSVSARYEGSSRFGANNKWGLFPAVSAGANISDIVAIPQVQSLKVRASYGRTGATPADPYISLQRFGPQGFFLYNGSYVPSYGPVSNPNPNLGWETKDEYNFGVDYAVLNGRLTGSIDYYVRVTKDMILPVNVPVPPNLFGTTFVNIGELRGSGLEFQADYKAISRPDFSYDVGINFSLPKTKVVSLTSGDLSFGEGGVLYRANMGAPGQNDTPLARVKEGQPLGQLWGAIQVGVDGSGAPIFQDLNGDGSFCNCNDDRTVIGNGLPKFLLGWNNTIRYKNFDLNLFFRGAFGHDLINSYRGFYENLNGTTVGAYNVVKTKYFDPEIKFAAVNNTHVEDASFIKLDNATLGYNFPVKASGIRNMRAFISGQNLFVITRYTGVDPEVRYVDVFDSDNGGRPGVPDPLSPGIERRSTYFTTRIITVGINLGF
jgi:iron complex outermembrane receptor protein